MWYYYKIKMKIFPFILSNYLNSNIKWNSSKNCKIIKFGEEATGKENTDTYCKWCKVYKILLCFSNVHKFLLL